MIYIFFGGFRLTTVKTIKTLTKKKREEERETETVDFRLKFYSCHKSKLRLFFRREFVTLFEKNLFYCEIFDFEEEKRIMRFWSNTRRGRERERKHYYGGLSCDVSTFQIILSPNDFAYNRHNENFLIIIIISLAFRVKLHSKQN